MSSEKLYVLLRELRPRLQVTVQELSDCQASFDKLDIRRNGCAPKIPENLRRIALALCWG
eukprot:421616-Pleurochrysis_carterae.AAC.1